ncbi:MAG: DUF805 domain-containing protein [Sphingosinicella sp.]
MNWMLMPLRRYAEFSGRSRRMEFWMWQLFKFLVSMVVYVLFFMMAGSAMMSGDPAQMMQVGGAATILIVVMGLFGLAIIIPDLAVQVRRLHDTNRTGWWILAPIVPYAIVVAMSAGALTSGSKDAVATMGPVAMILVLVAVVMAIVLLVFYFLDGTPGPNKYGPDPKAAERGQAAAPVT